MMKTEKTHWYECKIWKRFKHSGASNNDEWGLKRMLALKWCKSPYGGKHLCSFTDEEHEKLAEFKRRKDAGEETIRFDNVEDLIRDLDK